MSFPPAFVSQRRNMRSLNWAITADASSLAHLFGIPGVFLVPLRGLRSSLHSGHKLCGLAARRPAWERADGLVLILAPTRSGEHGGTRIEFIDCINVIVHAL